MPIDGVLVLGRDHEVEKVEMIVDRTKVQGKRRVRRSVSRLLHTNLRVIRGKGDKSRYCTFAYTENDQSSREHWDV